MIEAPAAHVLAEHLRQIEDRLERLLTSGWRQARSEAAHLRQEADALTEAGLPELGGRLVAVAEASNAGEALKAVALATSACRLLRVRLPSHQPPAGWTPLTPATRARASRTEALLPISRLLLDGREVWVCTRPTRNEILLVEPPFPSDATPAPAPAPAASGFLGRLKGQLGKALGGETAPPAHWLRRRLSGTLCWQAQYPFGVQGDVGRYTLANPRWVPETDEQDSLHHVRQALTSNRLQDGAALFWTSGGFRLRQLDRDDPSSFVWLDPTAAASFCAAPFEKVWSIVWMDGAAVAPVAMLLLGGSGRPPRLVHLIPGSPSDVIATAT